MISFWTLASIGFAAVAAAALVERPPPLRSRIHGAASRGRITRWFQTVATGRPGAPGLGRRLAVGGLAGLGVAVLGVGRLGPLGLVIPLAATVWAIVTVMLGYLEPAAARRRRAELSQDIPDVLDLLADALDAGLPLRSATEMAASLFDGPAAEDLGHVVFTLALGSSDVDAWSDLGSREGWERTAADVARSAESGTTVARTLREHARAARAASRAHVQVGARAVGVRSVPPLMVCFLPAFLLIGIVPTVASALGAAL